MKNNSRIVVAGLLIVFSLSLFGALIWSQFSQEIASQQTSFQENQKAFLDNESVEDEIILEEVVDLSQEEVLEEVEEVEEDVDEPLSFIIVEKSQIEWLSERQEVDPEKFDEGENLYKVAQIRGGSLAGYDIFSLEFASMGVDQSIFARKDNTIYVFGSEKVLKERQVYNSEMTLEDAFHQRIESFEFKFKEGGYENITLKKRTALSIEGLVYDSNLTIEVEGAKERLARSHSFGPSTLGNQPFDDNRLVKTAYEHPEYGFAYISNRNEDSEDEERSIFDAEGVYFKSPMNTFTVYQLNPRVLKESENTYESNLDVVWSDDKYDNKYNVQNFYGCGVTSYINGAMIDGYEDIARDDLTEIGKTFEGRSLYALSESHPFLVADFEAKETIFDAAFVKDALEGEGENDEIKNLKDYLSLRPVIFYEDVFGRFHAITRSIFQSPAECGKPVIYLYPEQSVDVNVQVMPTKGFTKVDPVYPEGGWDVHAYPSGKLFNYGDKLTYPYLFWEGLSDVFYAQPRKGFVVSRQFLGSLFDNTLKAQNLNEIEIADFKEFWVPKMLEDDAPFFFVTYTSEEFIDAAAPLFVTPKPDTIIRVMMDYEPLESQLERGEVEPMVFSPRERKGFTVVEWGGMLGK